MSLEKMKSIEIRSSQYINERSRLRAKEPTAFGYV